jgi:hypothetical protein
MFSRVVVLQECTGFVEDETGCYSEAYVTCDVVATEEVNIKVEEAIDIKDEIAEASMVTSVKTEHEVRLQGGCECVSECV